MGVGVSQKCNICVVVILLSVLFTGCVGDQDTAEEIRISGVMIYHPNLLEWLSDGFIEEHQIRPYPHLALFVPGPDDEGQRILKVYYNFQGPS